MVVLAGREEETGEGNESNFLESSCPREKGRERATAGRETNIIVTTQP